MKHFPKIKGSYLKFVKLSDIRPPHDVMLNECEELMWSLNTKGWIRRPLLGYKRGNKIQCFTGSHRIKAARYSAIAKIPVYVLQNKVLKRLRKKGLTNRNFCEFFYGGEPFLEEGLLRLHRLMLYDFR
jgi:ParB-like nuclease domain